MHIWIASYSQLDNWTKNISSLETTINRAKEETFIKHFSKNYQESLPPVWVVSEVMSLGELSRWYASIKSLKVKRAISSNYKLDHTVLKSWLHHLTLIRNICAHHSRLWNRDFSRLPPKISATKTRILLNAFSDDNKIYNSLLIIIYLLDIVFPGNNWRKKLFTLIDSYQDINVADMGFSQDWRKKVIWFGN